ncbi:phage major capsid protein [Sporolactobacillus sp. CQH2019]|uniref:phage major capsid protein n=1 Tax=Sporolactobacillus sp. CQH2019 TaxID=3023512 RepID=UPI0023689C18|nr:phage major capsid protein [Sporolactobacillus sp. CQH2019]MDD9149331.1 phage major capsid protein [Sporolactobacillus sp. CQH2019]
MTIEEKIARKKKELAEKRAELKTKITETRASVTSDGSDGSNTLSADEIQAAQKQISVIENDCKQCAADIDALEQISPLLNDPTDDGDSDSSTDQEQNADQSKQAAPANGSQAPAAQGAKAPAAKVPAADPNVKARSRVLTAEERGININKMHNVTVNEKRSLPNVKAFESYIRGKGQVRADPGITSTDASFGAIVPVQYLNASDQPLPPNSLAPIVNKISVNFRTGHYPIFKRQTLGMTKVNQLDPNAVTNNPSIIDCIYDLATYRQQVNIAQESIDDMNVDITGKISDFINEQKYLTEQYTIGSLLAAGSTAHAVNPVTVHSIDDIKFQSNVALNIAYTSRYFVATQSAFQILDTVKDAMGRPIVQGSLVDATKRSLFGYPLIIVQDVAMGAAGEKHLWLGDPKSYIAYFYKTDTTARWFAGYNYEVQLYAFYRADFQIADDEAGVSMLIGDDFTTQYSLAQGTSTTTTTTAGTTTTTTAG